MPRKTVKVQKTTLKLQKFLVSPVVGELDEEGNLIGERIAEPITVYTKQQANDLFEIIPAALADQEGQ